MNREKQCANRRLANYLRSQGYTEQEIRSRRHTGEQYIPYHNSERYADPTAFAALQNIVREERRAAKISDPARARYASPATARDRPRTHVWRAQGY